MLATLIAFGIGARLIYKKCEEINRDVVERLSVQGHTAVLILSFMWPITLAILWGSTCTLGCVTYLVAFGIPLIWSFFLIGKHNKFTRDTFGYILVFWIGLVGWFALPLVPVNCPTMQT